MDEEHTNTNPIQSLKNLLTEILHKNSAYDCMPINSSIQSIEKTVSLYDAVNILISKDLDELLVWDSEKNKWIWMLTLVDAIRFIIHALKSLKRHGYVDFSDFQKEKEEKKGQMISAVHECSKEQLDTILLQLQQKSIEDIIEEISYHSSSKNYIRLKSVQKESKISLVILTMSVEKIHRILVEDSESHMIIAVLNFKDIFLYILRMANDSPIEYYSSINIHSLLQQTGETKNIEINEQILLWEAFEIMTDREKSMWVNVVDKEGCFQGMIFREDFRGIFQGWNIEYLWMNVGQFLKWKSANNTSNVPEYRFFEPEEFTRDIVWKMVMTTRNTIVWVDKSKKVQATIGLMELFRLYVQ